MNVCLVNGKVANVNSPSYSAVQFPVVGRNSTGASSNSQSSPSTGSTALGSGSQPLPGSMSSVDGAVSYNVTQSNETATANGYGMIVSTPHESAATANGYSATVSTPHESAMPNLDWTAVFPPARDTNSLRPSKKRKRQTRLVRSCPMPLSFVRNLLGLS